MTICVVTAEDVKAKPYTIEDTFTGSSREEETDISEELDNLFLLLMGQRLDFLYQNLSPMFQVDTSSIYPRVESENETYLTRQLSDEEIISEMIESDFIIRMSPVKEYTARIKIRSAEKAVPRIIEPEAI